MRGGEEDDVGKQSQYYHGTDRQTEYPKLGAGGRYIEDHLKNMKAENKQKIVDFCCKNVSIVSIFNQFLGP